MEDRQKTVDPKILKRIRAMLAMTTESGASQAEAEFAAEKARELMAANGISNATIEAGGGQGESRVQDGRSGHTGKSWMRDIMGALAEQSFVTVEWSPGRKNTFDGKPRPGRWELWGRESAVATVKVMHEYLVRSVDRFARERGTPTDELFKAAMGGRIAERLRERHQNAMAEQARTAREEKARSSHPSSASTANALIVVLNDYAQSELDANEDMRRGLKPGTTAQQRLEREARERQREIEWEAKRLAAEKLKNELLAEGIDESVVYYMVLGFDRERSEKLAADAKKQEARQSRRSSRSSDEAYWNRVRRMQERQNSPSYRAGREAGNRVGLDTQVGKSSSNPKKLT